MGAVMNQEKLKAVVSELAKDIKTEQDLSDLTSHFIKLTVETALNKELDSHLGNDKHAVSGRNSGNGRNGSTPKTLKGKHGEVQVETPRDRNGDFEPQLVKKGQTRLTQFDNQIMCLYSKGMSTREIVAAFKEMSDADVSATLISQVTESVLEQVLLWQQRPLHAVYPIVYLDGLRVKVRDNKRVINKTIYLALGINLEGHKELLGLWIAQNEGAKFWLDVLTDLQNRGLKDTLIACVDGLTGFPDAILTVYPQAKVQLCIVHMVRNSLKYVSWKDYKAVTADLKRTYQSLTESEARRELDSFADTWDEKYPQISKSWQTHWPNLITLFDYPEEIRQVIYTTNAVESLNSVIRKVINKRKLFPHDDSAIKIVYLAIHEASKKWTMPIRNWKSALNRFMIEFEDRLVNHV